MKTVYVAGPVGAPEGRLERVRAAIAVGEQIAALGCAPFIPHLFHFWDEQFAHAYDFWMAFCFLWLRRCMALFRMPGESPGADKEVELARYLGIPVFYDMDALKRWAKGAGE